MYFKTGACSYGTLLVPVTAAEILTLVSTILALPVQSCMPLYGHGVTSTWQYLPSFIYTYCLLHVVVCGRHVELTSSQNIWGSCLGIHWYDQVHNDEVLRWTGQAVAPISHLVLPMHFPLWKYGSAWWRHTCKLVSTSTHYRIFRTTSRTWI